MRKKLIIAISGPSGAGKTTICRELRNSIKGVDYIVSYTSRPKRADEKEGSDYFFITEEDFLSRVERKEFLEWAEVHGFFYGTPLDQIDKSQKNDNISLLDLDVQGVSNLLKIYPWAVTVFILPPSPESLAKRLIRRGTEKREDFKKRIENAERELKKVNIYKYAVENDDVREAIDKIKCIISAEKCLVDEDYIKEVGNWTIKITE
ncbi:guanylate kinase [candidate division WOR-3 bacterium]|nr:guanylate kinase [candidate division WOR-3 bacterium]